MSEKNNELNLAAILALVTTGDMSKLSESQKIDYYNHVCQSMGLNPATRPFAFITLQGKLVLYAQRNCTDQLMSVREISAEVKSAKSEDGIFIVEARASTKEGRFADDLGCVSIEGLKGDAKANAIMKAHTKAKRRAVLSLVGLSFLDETEVETITAKTDAPKKEFKKIEAPKEEVKEEVKEKPPLWKSSYNGKDYINVRVGKTFSAEQLEFLGMKPSKKPGLYYSVFSENIWTALEGLAPKKTLVEAKKDDLFSKEDVEF